MYRKLPYILYNSRLAVQLSRVIIENCSHFRYGIHLYDIQCEDLWERKATIIYYTDLLMELLSLSINFVHHLHMLFSGNIWLSMASLVICMQVCNAMN